VSKAVRLTDDEVADRLAAMPEWSLRTGKLFREYKFADFVEAFGFMTRAALHIEKLNHHPEWFNVWATVRVQLTTHDCGGISVRDFELADVLDRLAAQ
jgi:4a-hydroxytetrahydrobiopterin dehydratase